MKRLTLSLLLSLTLFSASANAYDSLPGQWEQGKCMTFGEAYCETHPGCTMIVMVKLPKGHIVVQTPDGAFVDNLHPRPMHSRNLGVFYEENRYEMLGWHCMTRINWDHQTEQDRAVVAWLKNHEQN